MRRPLVLLIAGAVAAALAVAVVVAVVRKESSDDGPVAALPRVTHAYNGIKAATRR